MEWYRQKRVIPFSTSPLRVPVWIGIDRSELVLFLLALVEYQYGMVSTEAGHPF
jgi:hypothetical protein